MYYLIKFLIKSDRKCNAAPAWNNATLPITDAEWTVLPTLIAARLAVSLCIGAYSSSKDPSNEYLKLTLLPGWHAMQRLRQTPAADLADILRAAAGASRAKL